MVKTVQDGDLDAHAWPDHPMSPQPSYPAPQGWLATPSTPLSCGMASCWQINYILANSGRKNSIQILNQYPFLWKVLIWA